MTAWDFWGRLTRQVCLLLALWLFLEYNATNFDATEIKTWVGMILVGLGVEGTGLIAKVRHG
jgi:hypothetical protein